MTKEKPFKAKTIGSDPSVSENDKAIYWTLLNMEKNPRFENDDGMFAPTDKQISEFSGIKSVQPCLNALEKKNYISRKTKFNEDTGRRDRVIIIERGVGICHSK